MDDPTEKVLQNLFRDPLTKAARKVWVTNALGFAVDVNIGVSPGRFLKVAWLSPLGPQKASFDTSALYVVILSVRREFVCIQVIADDNSEANPVKLTPDMCCLPNEIYRPPEPSVAAIIPASSLPALIAQTMIKIPESIYRTIARTQYWKLDSDSYCLAPKEQKTVSVSVTTGMETTTSQEDVVAASLGLNASAGWGPISASLSVNLSASSTSFQSVMLSEQRTVYEQTVIENPTSDALMFLKWQLMDVISVYNSSSFEILSTVVSATKPVLVSGPWIFPKSIGMSGAAISTSDQRVWPESLRAQLAEMVTSRALDDVP